MKTLLALLLVVPVAAHAQSLPVTPEPGPEPVLSPPPPTPETPPPPAPTAVLRYDKGFLFATPDDKFTLKLSGRVQPRWELTYLDDGEDKVDHRFVVNRARITLDGTAYGTSFKAQTELARGFAFLRDFYLDRPIGPVVLRVGQHKKPFSRQHIESSANHQLVDRSLTDAFSGAGRDVGITLHNNYDKAPDGLEWAIGVYNGTGDKSKVTCAAETAPTTNAVDVTCGLPTNVPKDVGPQVAAHVGWNHGGIKAYSESDLEGGPFRFAVGASYLGELAEGDSDLFVHRVGVDAIAKIEGASFLAALYTVTSKATGSSETDLGFHVQGGYLVVPKELEVAARFALVPDAANADEDILEALGGVNVFFAGHAYKWQTNAGVLKPTIDGGKTSTVVQSQVQLAF